MFLPSLAITCPYCWEIISIEVDDSALPAQYVEDCSVCCRPILIHAGVDADGTVSATATAEND